MLIDDVFLDKLAEQAKANPRLRMNYDMRTSAEDQSQRMLNALEPGTLLPIHRHTGTTETVILLRGRMDEMFYDETGAEIQRFHLDASHGSYALTVPKGMWHTVEVLEPSVIFEAKDGPYAPLAPEDVK